MARPAVFALGFACALALAAASFAGEAEILRDVKVLASDELEGRATGSPGGAAAADYVARQFKAAGLEPASRGFEFVAGVKVGDGTALGFDLRGERLALSLEDESFRPLGFSSNGEASGEVVFCGYGITASELGYDDYGAVAVRGKVALVLDRVPGAQDPHGPKFSPEGITRYGQIRYKAMNAREHGAVAMLVVSSAPSGGKGDDPSLLPLIGNTTHGDAGILVADLGRSWAAKLFAGAGDSLDALQARIDGERTARSIALPGVAARLEIRLVKERGRTANVIAIRPGGDPVLKDEAIVVGAHYDHLGRGEIGGSLAETPPGTEIHNGADDNASGTAAVLEVARTLGKTRRTIVFAAFTGEELGTLGSSEYVKDPPFPLPGTVAMINMDMVGRLGTKKLTIGGMGTAIEWPELVTAAARRADIQWSGQDDGYGPSDHSSFYGKEVPVLFLFTGAHSDYHKPGDDWEKIDVTGTARVARFVDEVVQAIDGLDRRPTYQKTRGSPHGQDLDPGRGPQAYLGTIPDYSESETPGVRLTGVREGSPAEKAGIRGGDVIVRFDGKDVRNIYDYTYVLFAKKPGDAVDVVVRREGKEVHLRAVIGRKGRSPH